MHHAVRPGVSVEWGSSLRLTGEPRVAEWLRARPHGPLRAERYLHLDAEVWPVPWLSSLHVTLDAGRLVDVYADEGGPAYRAGLGTEVRISDRSLLGLSLQTQADGPSHSTQDFAQLELRQSAAPGAEVHLVATQHRVSHRLPAPHALNERERTLSLSLRRRWPALDAFYAGVTRARNKGAAGQRGDTTEFYVQIVHDTR